MHHHGQRVVSIAAEAPEFPWLIVGLIALAVLIGVGIWMMLQQERGAALGRFGPREVEENLEGQILSMLHQAGGSLLQTEIAAQLDTPLERVSGVLRDLQDSGRVQRAWEAGRYTYRIIHRHAQT